MTAGPEAVWVGPDQSLPWCLSLRAFRHDTWAGMSLRSEGCAFPSPELPHLPTPSRHCLK